MNKRDAEQRIQKLRELINDYRYHYHVLDESVMSEAAADSLKHELSQLESEFPDLITPDSPTQRVAGAPLPGFTQIEHSSRMLSLNDVFDENELKAWQKRIEKQLSEMGLLQASHSDAVQGSQEERAKRTDGTGSERETPADEAMRREPAGQQDMAVRGLEYFVDVKMDGFACALVYQDGVFVAAVTRGDGFVGEDVTANVRTLDSVPLRLRAAKGYEKFLQGRTEVRGEIVMYKKDFKKLNAERAKAGKPLFANPRNTAAGTIRQLDPKLVATRPLHFRAYDLLRDDASEIASYKYAYEALANLGFLVNREAPVFTDLAQVKRYADEWDTKRHDLVFNTDGLVIKVNDRAQYSRLGVVGKAPRAAVAYKYAAEQATTKVKDIFVSIGRTGVATPVAMLEPVVVAGSTVQMATLHNEGEVKRKDIRVGDTVIVHKAGDIIPEVVEPLLKLRTGTEKPFVMPTHCPECNTKLVKYNVKDAAWRCPNESCPSRAWKRIEHFASKAALDIEGLGEKNVIALLNAKLVNDQADIYTLKAADVIKLDRFAEVSANKLVNAIQAKKTPLLARFIYGLGIRHIGTQTAIDLANHFRSIEKLSEATIDELSDIEGIGDIVAEAVVEWFSEKRNQKLLAKFKQYGAWPQPVKQVGGKLAGQNFVVTGTLDSMSRDEAAERIRSQGGTFQSSVGKDTDYLVVGANVGRSKLVKAEKLGTKQVDEQEFLKIIGE